MAKYKLVQSGSPITTTGVIDTETGRSIPNNPDNRHWVEYEQWLTEGSPLNVPDSADVADWDSEGRSIRDQKLFATDWTRADDAPLDVGSPTKRNEFAAYRQALRDLPATYPDYGDVVWPTPPTYP